MNLEFIGKVVFAGEQTTFTTSQGKQVSERVVVLETEEQFPNSVAISLRDPKLLELPLYVGQTVKASLNCFAYASSNNPEHYFNSIRAWKIEVLG